jgi:hypothetical protein
MGPGDELARELLRDCVALDEAGEQALAEQLHHGIDVPALQPAKGAVFAEAAIHAQQVSVRVPLDQVPGGGDGDDDSRPAVRGDAFSEVLGHRLGGALREVEEELSTLAEDPSQEAGHGEHDVAVPDGREHLLL